MTSSRAPGYTQYILHGQVLEAVSSARYLWWISPVTSARTLMWTESKPMQLSHSHLSGLIVKVNQGSSFIKLYRVCGTDAACQESGSYDFWFWRRFSFTYGRGGYLGHLTWTIYINFLSPFPRRLHMKFGLESNELHSLNKEFTYLLCL